MYLKVIKEQIEFARQQAVRDAKKEWTFRCLKSRGTFSLPPTRAANSAARTPKLRRFSTIGHGGGTAKACVDCPPVDLAEICAAGEESPIQLAGTMYLMANFQPRIREVIATMGTPQDGRPLFRDGSIAHGASGVCTQGIGTRGGKSRGIGSGSRMLKVMCPQGGCAGGAMAYVARVSAAWLDAPGAPLCPAHNVALVRA